MMLVGTGHEQSGRERPGQVERRFVCGFQRQYPRTVADRDAGLGAERSDHRLGDAQ